MISKPKLSLENGDEEFKEMLGVSIASQLRLTREHPGLATFKVAKIIAEAFGDDAEMLALYIKNHARTKLKNYL